MSKHAIIRGGYVVNMVEWDPEAAPGWTYPHPHDKVVQDLDENVAVGDWYEEAEDIFYRPLRTPSDLPEELQV